MVPYLPRQGPHPPGSSVLGPGSFRRIVDVPVETCVAALDSWQRTEHGGELRFGGQCCRGPIEHDRDSATRRIQAAWPGVRCARCCA